MNPSKRECRHFWMPGGYTVTPKDYQILQGYGPEHEHHDASYLYCAKCLKTKVRDRFGPSLFGPEAA